MRLCADVLQLMYDSLIFAPFSPGPPPVYVGFGSIVVDDPEKLTATIFEAVRELGLRAIVSQGWGGVGGGGGIPDSVYIIGPCPHDWCVKCVWSVCGMCEECGACALCLTDCVDSLLFHPHSLPQALPTVQFRVSSRRGGHDVYRYSHAHTHTHTHMHTYF